MSQPPKDQLVKSTNQLGPRHAFPFCDRPKRVSWNEWKVKVFWSGLFVLTRCLYGGKEGYGEYCQDVGSAVGSWQLLSWCCANNRHTHTHTHTYTHHTHTHTTHTHTTNTYTHHTHIHTPHTHTPNTQTHTSIWYMEFFSWLYTTALFICAFYRARIPVCCSGGPAWLNAVLTFIIRCDTLTAVGLSPGGSTRLHTNNT